MRIFSHNEKEILNRIASIEKGKIISLNTFLEEFFFTEDSGRALIIQAQAHYAVFFLKTEIFDDPLKKGEELEKFLDIISLITYLKHHGYISLFRGEKSKEKLMFFIQDGFVSAQPSKGVIILNPNGDYTSSPDTIHDKNNNVIYKGLVSERDNYEMILSSATGSLIVSSQINNLIKDINTPTETVKSSQNETETENEKQAGDKPEINPVSNASSIKQINLEKEEKEKEEKEETEIKNKEEDTQGKVIPGQTKTRLALWLSIISLLIFISVSILVYLKFTKYDSEIGVLLKSHENIQNKINKLSLKIELNDSLILIKRIDTLPEIDAKNYYYGIDISKWNGNEASEIPQKDSITFIICKATEGIHKIDRNFKKNWEIIRSNNYILGAYHFYYTSKDPVKQAEHFWLTISSQGQTDIAPIVDIEQRSIPKNANTDPTVIQKNLLIFLEYLEKKCNRTPMIYTELPFADKYLQNKLLSEYPLWLAEYTNASEPRLPKTWEKNGYKIWQKRDNYFIDSYPTDFDIFYGRKSELIQ